MRVQVIHNRRYFFRALVSISNLFQKTRPILFGFSLSDSHHALSGQRFTSKKNITHTATSVFISVPGQSPRQCRDRELCLRDQLLWGFVHADNRMKRIKRALVYVQHHFHIRHKAAVLLRWDYPSFLPPRLEFVFFKMRRTASWEMLSI